MCPLVFTFFTGVVLCVANSAGIIFGPDAEDVRVPSCGEPAIQYRQRRIVGGEEAQPGSWPWMALLARDGNVACGGSIIHEKLILTAAHCFADTFDESPTVWQVYVGKHHVTSSDDTQQQFGLRRIARHPQFNNMTLANDLAIVEIEGSMEYTNYTSPICLPVNSSRVVPLNTYCYITGWGDTRGTGDSNVLNQAVVPILHDYWCSRADWYGSLFQRNTTFCAGYKSGIRDACSGDSGGPLACEAGGKWFLQGVTSWGHDCAQPQYPGIYVDVPLYVAWIRDTALKIGYLVQ